MPDARGRHGKRANGNNFSTGFRLAVQ